MNNAQAIDQKKPGKTRSIDIVHQGLARRYKSERRFRRIGLSAIIVSLLFLSFLFISIIGNGWTALFQTHIQINVHFNPDTLPLDGLSGADYPGLVKATLRDMFPGAKGAQRQARPIQTG